MPEKYTPTHTHTHMHTKYKHIDRHMCTNYIQTHAHTHTERHFLCLLYLHQGIEHPRHEGKLSPIKVYDGSTAPAGVVAEKVKCQVRELLLLSHSTHWNAVNHVICKFSCGIQSVESTLHTYYNSPLVRQYNP